MTVGERIKARREELGLTQKDLSEITGLEQVTVRIYENDSDHMDLSVIRIEKIAKALSVSPAVLVGWEKPKEDIKKQLYGMISKQKAMVVTEQDETRRNVLIAMCIATLNGLKLTNALGMQEYNKQYDELQEFVERIGEHEKYQKNHIDIGRTGYSYELKGKC